MSMLIDVLQTDCILLTKQFVPDGYGGASSTIWVESGEFKAVIIDPQSVEKEIAKKMDVTSVYSVGTSRDIILNPYDVFKRKEDGKIFRVASSGADTATPKTSAIDMRYVKAEQWTLPTT